MLVMHLLSQDTERGAGENGCRVSGEGSGGMGLPSLAREGQSTPSTKWRQGCEWTASCMSYECMSRIQAISTTSLQILLLGIIAILQGYSLCQDFPIIFHYKDDSIYIYIIYIHISIYMKISNEHSNL